MKNGELKSYGPYYLNYNDTLLFEYTIEDRRKEIDNFIIDRINHDLYRVTVYIDNLFDSFILKLHLDEGFLLDNNIRINDKTKFEYSIISSPLGLDGLTQDESETVKHVRGVLLSGSYW